MVPSLVLTVPTTVVAHKNTTKFIRATKQFVQSELHIKQISSKKVRTPGRTFAFAKMN